MSDSALGRGGRPVPVPREPPVQLCAFWVGGEEYMLDIMRIEEILPLMPVTSVPRAPVFVDGVINLRGSILPVVDLRRRLRAGPPAHHRLKPKLLICRIGPRRVALRVDGVSEIARVQRVDIRPAPALSSDGNSPYVVAVCGSPSRMRLLLDIKAVLRAEPGEQQESSGQSGAGVRPPEGDAGQGTGT